MYFNIIISFFLILFIDLTAEQGSGSFEVRDHSLSRPYPNVFSTSNSHWHLTGNTLATDRYIRLTADAQSKIGGLWNTIPVAYPDWEMHVHFKVHGDVKHLFGDGFAIWYVRDLKLNGPVLGYQDYFYGLAIIMDTYPNQVDAHPHSYPYISAVVNNGSLHYNHDRDGADIKIGGCESQFRGREVDTLVAIRYLDNRLIVSTDVDGQNTWTECFAIDNVHLPTHYYFGFTAATGQLTDNHDIISVHMYQLDSSEQRRKEDRKHIMPSGPATKLGDMTITVLPTSWSAWKIFFIVIAVIVICLGAVGAYYYQQNRRYHSSRLF